MPFTGQLMIPGDLRPLRAEIDITPTDLVVSTGVGPVGRWPLELCHVSPDNGRFVLSIDDEVAWFVPDDAVTFTRRVLDRWSAPDLASAVKAVRDATEGAGHESAGEISQKATGIGSFDDLAKRLRALRPIHLAGILLVVVSVLLIAAALGRGGDRRTVLGTLPPASSTTIFPAVFSSGLDQVTELWNEAAEGLGVDLFIAEIYSGTRMQVDLPGDLILYGTVYPGSSRVRTLMISAGPGDGESGEVVLASWGTLIAVVNPELDAEGRRVLLERLGVDVNRPLTLGLTTQTVEGAASYWLRSGVLGGRVHFGVQPVSPPRT